MVEALYDRLGEPPSAIEQAAVKKQQYDTAIGLLEGQIIGNRTTVRAHITAILTPDLTRRNAMATHEALLTLAHTRDGPYRLVTTNFDRLFEKTIADRRLSVRCYEAPLLPLPKNRMDGLIYLHGMLREQPTATELNGLVLSSGDFGLAYLTERWAARFVSELFRNYTVCFVVTA